MHTDKKGVTCLSPNNCRFSVHYQEEQVAAGALCAFWSVGIREDETDGEATVCLHWLFLKRHPGFYALCQQSITLGHLLDHVL